MADYREMMDKMRREGQNEQATRVGSTAMRYPSSAEAKQAPVNPVWSEGPKPRDYAQVTASGGWETPLVPGVYSGSGGYEYELREDGSLKIVKSPKSGGGQEIIPGGFVHDIVMNDIKREKTWNETQRQFSEENLARPLPGLEKARLAFEKKLAEKQRQNEIDALEFKSAAADIEYEPSGSMMTKK